MAAPKKIPEKLEAAQFKASDPAGSAWVSANAGSGKTYVLAQRVTRLLLNGVDPSKILCLTFTKVAAANMALRVFKTLASWTTMDDASLRAEIGKIERKPPDAARLLRARRLFAETLETPGGLKVQTIHAFCSALMHQFPFESGVSAGFEVMEERAQDELINLLRIEVLLEAAQKPGTGLATALSTALIVAADITFSDVVKQAVMRRSAYEAWLKRAESAEAALEELNVTFGVAANDTTDVIDAEILARGLPRTDWANAAAVFAEGSESDKKQGARLRRALSNGGSGLDDYLDVFCTEDGMRKSLATKGLAADYPELMARLDVEKERLAGLMERRRAIVARDRAAALATVTFEIVTRYRSEKSRRGLLDYDDLIEKTRALLDAYGSAWVMYRLDLGIDHLLIDEAQDTSPSQWDVITMLTAEFFAGQGARAHVRRSIFAVGDEKQSIYSFQGAAPHLFDEKRQHYEKLHKRAKLTFSRVPLRHSFRSTVDVLGAVDEVFKDPRAHAGLAHDPVATLHEAVRADAPGSIEIWPLADPPERKQPEPWDAPFDAVSEESPPVILARRIARYVASAIAAKEPVEARDGAPLRPGDILILVRQRGPLFEAVIRALKVANVEVAGADRLVLTDHIAVMDLMALADALLMRDDDLALAEVLKSPLFGFDDDALFALAYGRGKKPLRDVLDGAADPRFAKVAARFKELEQCARSEGAFDFYARLLGADGGRRQILARLGHEADDALDEFLALAIDYERNNPPSLQGFVAWLRAANAEVKRDMDVARDEVRVMTVHGAKGLEAPIVILADTTNLPRGPEPSIVSATAREDSPLLWLGRKQEDAAAGNAARLTAHRAAEHEHLRLLYVAMTRAQDKLIVCGARRQKKNPENCWYDLVSEALKPGAVERRAPDGEIVWRWQKSPELLGLPRPKPVVVTAAPEAPPAWLRQPIAAASQDARISPSQALAKRRARSPEQEAAALRARERGVVVHRLLQSLPDVGPEHRKTAAETFLAQRSALLPAEERASIIANVMSIVSNARFAAVFAPGSQAEVPLVGTLTKLNGETFTVSGQIDRLAVTEQDVLIADFKTDRDAGKGGSLAQYATQLALYRALLGPLYPNRTIRAVLIWTETAQAQEITAEFLDRAAVEFGLAGS
ncbi:ATP-dependent helicase/nuclease subunit A [Variibacter gotjawalensis]|uniref:DNA 3'-5' helicase n=1 Tax=Variibacter gotjawalensis TaxID=1333996 RepID=A0A0S3Q0M0_9BRAD|nr:ATP-dependent helicase/nuclease subunit A [Variibacter gotjawalensis]RZS49464.1 DNA helicase/exodeoxyribonuclease V subunit A [Variibacter gotjawalensis]BAT61727.1 ATP-dependent helicase/nuclease subunit A [Variibacter gotjawalensis]